MLSGWACLQQGAAVAVRTWLHSTMSSVQLLVCSGLFHAAAAAVLQLLVIVLKHMQNLSLLAVARVMWRLG